MTEEIEAPPVGAGQASEPAQHPRHPRRAHRTRDPAALGLHEYAQAVAEVCPYMLPSQRGGQTWWTRLRPPAASHRAIESLVFASGVTAAERVRARRAAGDTLACEVLAIDTAQPSTVVNLPHLALKHLYATVGITVGCFAPDRQHELTSGKLIPAAPTVVLALRTAVPRRDAQLLGHMPSSALHIARGSDDGREVLSAVPSLAAGADPISAWRKVRPWIRAQRCDEEV
ncbi:hypothetical protein [Streptomyces noursei]|uniref:hypothetical protein n=1 Tax=Streptomyces noursei TaxID=1971 RepID=UPI00381D4B3E